MPAAGCTSEPSALLTTPRTPSERDEMIALRILSADGSPLPPGSRPGTGPSIAPIERKAMTAAEVLNEAYCYERPSSFARGIRFDLGDKTMLMISGTASIDHTGATVHVGISGRSCGGPTVTSRRCWPLKGPPGRTWSAPPAT